MNNYDRRAVGGMSVSQMRCVLLDIKDNVDGQTLLYGLPALVHELWEEDKIECIKILGELFDAARDGKLVFGNPDWGEFTAATLKLLLCVLESGGVEPCIMHKLPIVLRSIVGYNKKAAVTPTMCCVEVHGYTVGRIALLHYTSCNKCISELLLEIVAQDLSVELCSSSSEAVVLDDFMRVVNVGTELLSGLNHAYVKIAVIRTLCSLLSTLNKPVSRDWMLMVIEYMHQMGTVERMCNTLCAVACNATNAHCIIRNMTVFALLDCLRPEHTRAIVDALMKTLALNSSSCRVILEIYAFLLLAVPRDTFSDDLLHELASCTAKTLTEYIDVRATAADMEKLPVLYRDARLAFRALRYPKRAVPVLLDGLYKIMQRKFPSLLESS